MPDNGRKVIRVQGSSGDRPAPTLRITVGQSHSGAQGQHPAADLVLIVDTTGSMSDKIDGLVRTLQRFADRLNKKNVTWQASVIAFGDLTVQGDKIVATPFTDRLDVVKKALSSLPRFSGGGNVGESSLEALDKAIHLQGFRVKAMKVFVLITDEPALQHSVTAEEMTRRLRTHGVLTFVVSPPESYFQSMAKQTAGAWFPIASDTDLSSILAVFDRLSDAIAVTVQRVQLTAGGSVTDYLQLPESTS